MTFKECFIDYLRKSGVKEKEITLMLMDCQIAGDPGMDDPAQMTEKEIMAMQGMMQVFMSLPPDQIIAGAEKIRNKRRRLN